MRSARFSWVRRTVFLSHSSNKDPGELLADDPRLRRLLRARAVREAIVSRLADDFDVWLDVDRVRPADPWRLEIYRALHRCSAAVLLLDDDALASPWVLQEATILNFRGRLNPGFVLVPVLVDGGSSSRLEEGVWRPLALREVQALKNDAPADIAERVAERLGNLAGPNDPGIENWLNRLVGRLRPVARDYPELMDEACKPLTVCTEDWAADNASAVWSFAQALFSAHPQAVIKVAGVISDAAEGESRRRIQRLLAPLWIDLVAAGNTASILGGPPGRRRPLLNTDDHDVAREYVERAVNCAARVYVVPSHDVFGEDPGEFFDLLEKQVIAELPTLRRDSSSSTFARWLREYDDRKVVLVVAAVLPVAAMGTLLDRLAERFPGLEFIVLGGPQPPTPGELQSIMVDAVEPPLDEDSVLGASLYRGELTIFAEG